MAAKSAMSRKWRAGALHAGRAAAFLAIATGVNSVLTELYPRYEPIYVYLVAVLVVAWLSSTILGVTAAVAAAILYDWMFAPVRVVPHVSFAIPLTVAVLVAVATRAARLPLRERAALAEPVQALPLLPSIERPAPVDVIVDDTHIRELEAQLAEMKQRLSDALHRADESERLREQERATAESRQTLLSKEIDALKQTVGEQSGRAALARREADAIAQRVAESDAQIASIQQQLEAAEKKAEDESARADREAKAREQLEVAGHESLQKAAVDLSTRNEASLAEAKERTDAASGRREELQAALADREKQGEAAGAKMQALQRELDRTLATLSEEHARADRESKLRAQLETAARKTLKTTAVVSSTHQKEAIEAREAAQRAEERATELEQRSDTLQNEIEELRGELTAARAEHEARAALADELAAAKTAFEEQEAGRIAAEADRQKFADESAALRKELDTLREDVDSERRRADHLHAAVEAADAEVEMARSDVQTAQQELADLQAGREKMTADFDAKLQKIVTGLAEDHENAIGDALLEREAAKAELRRITQRMQELERTVEEERTRAEHEKTAREKLDSEWSEKLQKIVAHLTEDHESDVGEAMLQREAARAEVRTLTLKLAAAQKLIEEERAKFMRFTRRESVVPTVEQPLPFPEAASTAPHVVLVVHSDAGVRAMTKHTLEQAGYTVATAADGLEALRSVAQRKPDIILAEAVMPKMNARELVQLLKSKRETADVKIVLLTSRNEPARIIDFTPDDVVRNPADFNELRTTLANVLARGVRS